MTRIYSHMMKPAGVGCVEWGSILRTKSYLDIIFVQYDLALGINKSTRALVNGAASE